MENLDDKARKIQEIGNLLGWNSDLETLVQRVKSLDAGLVKEDEFVYLLNWSNKCSLIQKVDQSLITDEVKKQYTIPDLFVVFNKDGQEIPYFIEVKTSKDEKLSWTERYYQGLINYSKLTGHPVLIAWKWSSFDVWTLFELKHFEKSVSNYKIGFEKAHQESLMSKLAGDYFIVPYENFAINFKLKKEKLISKNGNEAEWEMQFESIYLTGEDGIETTDLDPGILSVLFSMSSEEKLTETDTHFIQSIYPHPNKSSFAQSIPIRLALAYEDGEVNWLEKIKSKKYPVQYDVLLRDLTSGIDKYIIRNILFFVPKSDSK